MSAITPAQIALLDGSLAAVLPRVTLGGLAGRRLFITGGTGFFGLWLLSALRALNAQGLGLHACVLSRDPGRFLGRHPQFAGQPWLQFTAGDVRDFQAPPGCFDALIHAATETSMAVHAQPQRMLEDIVLGTRRVLAFAREAGIQRSLLVSSGAVYGRQPADWTHQPDESPLACNPLLPSSAYGEGKRVMELLGAICQQDHGVASVVARCFAFAGPGLPLDAHFAIGNFLRDALQGTHITVQGDGTPERSYLYGADLALWLLKLLQDGDAGQSYNVGSDLALSIADLAYQVRDLVAPGLAVQVLQPSPPDAGPPQRYVPAIHRARALGCAPWTPLDEAIRLSAAYWRAG
ncbi:NAD-dependent epimerase/dehydratase family protein [Inhella gelatinilytica]|uniref:NAD-dependent epimerase/dehydratase family protein n=1 Tax=Inhella gelatinilytica TaxID=2795030 RepID=A0A931IZI0_9BURK|nr:NAD-dependent epimerase/dehydratase family protein [Inhella gelatinilytica]MBH9553875.1 NAD-dependent epimerase/dehydratase family protein [Inhella gelatinilytica]